MGSNPEELAELQRRSAERIQQDYLNTNILQSDDPALMIAQDAIIGYAASEAIESVTIDVLRKNLVAALTKDVAVEIPIKSSIKGLTKTLKLGPKALVKTIQTISTRSITKAVKASKVLTSAPKLLKAIATATKAAIRAARAAMAATKAAVRATVTAVKVSVKAGTVMAQAAAKGAMMMGAICAATGPATGGVGCLVGLAVMVLQLAFDAFNLAMDILDPNGTSVVIYKTDIEMVAKTTGEWVNNEYGEGNANYLDEEVFFDWESHLYEIDDDGNIVANEEWTTKYENYRDEYMTNLGITGDWRARIPSVNTVLASDPGVLSPMTLVLQEYKKEADLYFESKKPKESSSTLLFIIILFTIIFLTFIIFFFII
jgi:hypothetical protein